MTKERLDYLLWLLRRNGGLRSATGPVMNGPQPSCTESEAQWLLKNNYIVYNRQEGHFAVWFPSERIK